MDVREKLVELLDDATVENITYIRDGHPVSGCFTKLVKVGYAGVLADNLIAHGVTVQELDGCFRCKDSKEMTVTIINKLIDGVITGWHGGNLPARYCPFCGRRLPQPPKGE